MPGTEKRTWFFLDLASFEGILRGAIKPGFIATYVQDNENPDPLVDRGAAPQAVREGLLMFARYQERRPLPTVKRADGTSEIDWSAVAMVPEWARPRSDRNPRALPPISGGSDAQFNDAGVTSRPPI